MLSSKEKEDIAVASAINYFISNSYEVCLPIGDKRDYDFVVEKKGVLYKVQVKYAGKYASHNNQCRVGLRITGGNKSGNSVKKYTDNAFDFLFVFSDNNKRNLLPWSEIKARNEIQIEHSKYDMYNV